MLTEWDILGNILRFSKRMSGKTKLAFLKPVNLILSCYYYTTYLLQLFCCYAYSIITLNKQGGDSKLPGQAREIMCTSIKLKSVSQHFSLHSRLKNKDKHTC